MSTQRALEVCSQIAQVAGDKRRYYLQRVMHVEMPGLRWRGTCASDGHIALLVEGDHGGVPPEVDVELIFRSEPHGFASASCRSLKEWCGDDLWPQPGPCPDCRGEKVAMCGTCSGTGACDHCEQDCPNCDDGKAKCNECNGTGTTDRCYVEQRPAWLTEHCLVDRVLLGRLLAAFDDDAEIELLLPRSCEEPIYIYDGSDLLGMLCGMNPNLCTPPASTALLSATPLASRDVAEALEGGE